MSDCSDSVTWFDQSWIGRIIEFENGTWKIADKILEHEKRWLKWEWESGKFDSEAKGVFICEDIKTSTQAIMKIWKQIPYTEGETDPPELRALQALPDQCYPAQKEIEALETLTKAQCFCTPIFQAKKHETQDCNDWVPGRFLDFLVMEKLEGSTVTSELFRTLNHEEFERLRTAFKKSYIQCLNLDFMHLDEGARNLIWNKDKGIWYLIIDWEKWCQAKWHGWRDNEYFSWELDHGWFRPASS